MSPVGETIINLAREPSLLIVSGGAFSGLLLASLLIIISQGAYRLFFHSLRHIPGPFWAKVTSFYFLPSTFRADRVYVLEKLHQKYGPIVRVGPNEVSLSDWKMYRPVYTSKQNFKDPRFYGAFAFLGHGNVFASTDAADHSGRRKLQAKSYSQQEIAAHASTIVEKTDVLIDRLLKSASDSPTQTADAYDLLGAWGLEIICNLLANVDMPDDPSETIHVLEALESSPPAFFANILVPWLQTFKSRTKIPGTIGHSYRAFAKWERVTIRMMKNFQNQKQDPEEKRRFAVTPLLEANNKHLGRNFTFREALEEAMGSVLAGSGVSGHTFTYLVYALARPEGRPIQERLRQELKGAGDSLGELMALPYLTAVIKETYRRFPAIMSTLPRILGQPLEVIGTGMTLPSGTVVGMQNWVHHRDSVLFPQPDKFIPERWIEGHEMSKGVNLQDANAALTPYSGRRLPRPSFTLPCRALRDDMHMRDLWAVQPKGRRLFLDIKPLDN
ncbi:cytochrome P450 [Ilyonectria sp. MPI-CAGE-AT-0026]|nr:cytochrome P450 [Ilyonectria sp. MPI-CAGE-AT-0026]